MTEYDTTVGSWTAVQVYKQIDLETTPLEIKTDSAVGSGDYVYVYFYTSQGDIAGGVNLRLTSTLQYCINFCTSCTNFPTNPPADVNKVWRITKTRTSGIRLQIHCNDVEVLNILMSDTTCSSSSWSTFWDRNIRKMYFRFSDSASDFYMSPEGNYIYISFIYSLII